MAQAGMPVAAEAARLSCRDVVLTHFPRPEDRDLRQGKLDEELARLSQCIDALTPQALLLSNESCAVTNQREGARILSDVADAVHDYGARAVYVTHLHELALAVRDWRTPAKQLLRAERGATGERSFRIVPGEPEATSHGVDLYERIIGPDANATPAGRS
jgi:DNA mismatch repair ATPase MutS